MTETELIGYIKPYLKAKGYKKKNKRWTKTIEDFTLNFFIQGSSFNKDTYYIRPGVFINALLPTDYFYGHFSIEIAQTNPQQVIDDYEVFCNNWTDKKYIKKTIIDFMEWEERNPLEKRREGLCDYEKDPPPSEVCFTVFKDTKEYALNNF